MLPSRLTLGLGIALLVTLIAAGGTVKWMHGRLDAVRAELVVARANVETLQAAVSEQNAAVDRLRADSAARVERAAKAVAAAQRPRPRVVSAMGAPPKGGTVAERVEDIDRRFLESLE